MKSLFQIFVPGRRRHPLHGSGLFVPAEQVLPDRNPGIPGDHIGQQTGLIEAPAAGPGRGKRDRDQQIGPGKDPSGSLFPQAPGHFPAEIVGIFPPAAVFKAVNGSGHAAIGKYSGPPPVYMADTAALGAEFLLRPDIPAAAKAGAAADPFRQVLAFPADQAAEGADRPVTDRASPGKEETQEQILFRLRNCL